MVQAINRALEQALGAGYGFGKSFGVGRAPVLERRQRHADGRQGLAQLVVHFAADPPALLLLRLEDFAGKDS